jgi:8-oxo-dGTP pyrophosphatase MutT (NUDIX family)
MTIRCRALIVNNEKLFVVKHGEEFDYYALPGGKLEVGENPLECIKRELKEELGVEVKQAKLAYVYRWVKEATNEENLEFIFLIPDSESFVDISANNRSHAFEIVDMKWLDKDSDIKVLPDFIKKEFKENNFDLKEVKFI